jgi:hypothetical protein
VCEGALVFALLLFNPFELVSVRFYSGHGQAVRAGSQARAAVEFFEKIDMAESDNLLTKLQDLLLYLSPEA